MPKKHSLSCGQQQASHWYPQLSVDINFEGPEQETCQVPELLRHLPKTDSKRSAVTRTTPPSVGFSFNCDVNQGANLPDSLH